MTIYLVLDCEHNVRRVIKSKRSKDKIITTFDRAVFGESLVFLNRHTIDYIKELDSLHRPIRELPAIVRFVGD